MLLTWYRTCDFYRNDYTRSGAEGPRGPGDLGIGPTAAERRPRVQITWRQSHEKNPSQNVYFVGDSLFYQQFVKQEIAI